MVNTEIKDSVLRIYGQESLSLARSCFCGQAFRWTEKDGIFTCVIGESLIHAYKEGDILCISPCDAHSAPEYIRYFDLDRDYGAIEGKMSANDVLKRCIPYAAGIRVFNQDPFEALISFIISANNNVKRITLIIDRLCQRYGNRHVSPDGTEYYSFPTPEALSNASLEELRSLGTGYRDEYIKRTAKAVADGFSLEELRNMPYPLAKKRLCTLHGVGGKVADCVLLFSLGHGEAFPMDVWMKRAVSTMFFGGKEPQKDELTALLDTFGTDAGRIQQYIFHYARETGLKDFSAG